MQIKTIEKAITNKMREWLKTISDEKLSRDISDNLLVSGGSIASMLLNVPINDYDVYLMDIDVLKRLAEYYTYKWQGITVLDGRRKEQLTINVDKFQMNSYDISVENLKEDQIKLYFKDANGGLRVNEAEKALNYTPLFFSANAISLSNDLQVVLRFWGNTEQIHKTFDYVHATNYFTFKEGLVCNLEAMQSLLTKQLKYQGSLYPVTSIIRAKKFIKRGFNISAGEMLKIAFQISELNLSNPNILEEQLIGVDVAYFDLLISSLREKTYTDPNFKMSSLYLNSIIDKIFNSAEDLD